MSKQTNGSFLPSIPNGEPWGQLRPLTVFLAVQYTGDTGEVHNNEVIDADLDVGTNRVVQRRVRIAARDLKDLDAVNEIEGEANSI